MKPLLICFGSVRCLSKYGTAFLVFILIRPLLGFPYASGSSIIWCQLLIMTPLGIVFLGLLFQPYGTIGTNVCLLEKLSTWPASIIAHVHKHNSHLMDDGLSAIRMVLWLGMALRLVAVFFGIHMGGGFSQRLGTCSVLMAELWGILTSLAWSWHGLMAVDSLLIMESDSLVAVQLITGSCPQTHPCYRLVSQIHQFLGRQWRVAFHHIFRESNQVTDWLTGFAHSVSMCFVRLLLGVVFLCCGMIMLVRGLIVALGSSF